MHPVDSSVDFRRMIMSWLTHWSLKYMHGKANIFFSSRCNPAVKTRFERAALLRTSSILPLTKIRRESLRSPFDTSRGRRRPTWTTMSHNLSTPLWQPCRVIEQVALLSFSDERRWREMLMRMKWHLDVENCLGRMLDNWLIGFFPARSSARVFNDLCAEAPGIETSQIGSEERREHYLVFRRGSNETGNEYVRINVGYWGVRLTKTSCEARRINVSLMFVQSTVGKDHWRTIFAEKQR